MNVEPIRVLLVDDSLLFRRGLLSLLQAVDDIEVVGEASDGREALEKAETLMPDVILMDVRMPDWDGLTATRLIKEQMPYVKLSLIHI